MATIQDSDLADVLLAAEADDLKLLIDVITDNGNGRISLSSAICRRLNDAKDGDIDEMTRAIIAEELMRFGGNSLMNFVRGGSGVSYRELLTDVASHVGAPVSQHTLCAEMEMAIIAKMAEQSIIKMSEDDRATFFQSMGTSYHRGMAPAALAALLATLRSTNVASYGLSAVVASATMNSLVGRGIVLAAGSTALGRGLAVLAGPLGWAITGIWTAFDLASPAYRVTVPCVIQVGHMRQKMMLTSACPGCKAPVTLGTKFCPQCGTTLTRQLLPRA